MLRLGWVSLVFCFLLIGCAPNESSVAESETAKSQGQNLPITAEVKINGEIIKLEVANTREQQSLGLMYREELPPNRGMLFPLKPPRQPRFWMKNVEISLDMIFLSQGKVRAIAQEVPPCTETPCPTYGTEAIIDQVIELQGGRAEELELEVGDSLIIEYQ